MVEKRITVGAKVSPLDEFSKVLSVKDARQKLRTHLGSKLADIIFASFGPRWAVAFFSGRTFTVTTAVPRVPGTCSVTIRRPVHIQSVARGTGT